MPYVKCISKIQGTKVKHVECQNTTDMQKCFNLITELVDSAQMEDQTILVWGAIGGRFDHTIGALHSVMASAPCQRVYLLQEGNI